MFYKFSGPCCSPLNYSFSEIIPQSLCTRYGLAIGAQMAWFVRLLIFAIVSKVVYVVVSMPD